MLQVPRSRPTRSQPHAIPIPLLPGNQTQCPEIGESVRPGQSAWGGTLACCPSLPLAGEDTRVQPALGIACHPPPHPQYLCQANMPGAPPKGLPGAIFRDMSHPELFVGPGMHCAAHLPVSALLPARNVVLTDPPCWPVPAGSQGSAGAPLPPRSLSGTLPPGGGDRAEGRERQAHHRVQVPQESRQWCLDGNKVWGSGSDQKGVQGRPLRGSEHPAGPNDRREPTRENVDGEDCVIHDSPERGLRNPQKLQRGTGQGGGVDPAFSRWCLSHKQALELALLAP